MRKLYTLLAVSSFLALSSPVHAESGQLGLGIKGGTQGVGLELSMDVNSYLEIRAGINQISFDFDTTIGDIDYNFAPDFFTSSLLLDLHPFGNAFRLTIGS
ncbi:MAG: hypothetical protein D3908_03715, partial [Candidatus Electrothrix sp. AUS4]|nr:hypothetical protein [Candidatus Electrothrix sp. AUS4]